jgi:hypothetical protein
MGNWIFGLLGCAVYGEPVLGTIVAYSVQGNAAIGLAPGQLESWRAATYACSRLLEKESHAIESEGVCFGFPARRGLRAGSRQVGLTSKAPPPGLAA